MIPNSASSLKSPRKIVSNNFLSDMPDVSAQEEAVTAEKLNAVGMRGIEMPILIQDFDKNRTYHKAKIDAFVSLDDSKAKGIHMSRLYLGLQEELKDQALNWDLIKTLLLRFIESQKGLSQSSFLRVKFDWPLKRKTLLSSKWSWKYYPVLFEGKFQNGEFEFILGAKILYSSTCPCSEALTRQAIQAQFLKDFPHKRKSLTVSQVLEWLSLPPVATPHAQRSLLKFKVKLSPPSYPLELPNLIDSVEKSLGTPVQPLVKREDEQEFARLNASHLMFCEDAARKVKSLLEPQSHIKDYIIFVEHIESLHPHTASSFTYKGVEGGFC